MAGVQPRGTLPAISKHRRNRLQPGATEPWWSHIHFGGSSPPVPALKSDGILISGPVVEFSSHHRACLEPHIEKEIEV